MRNLVTVVILVALGWYAYSQFQRRAHIESIEAPVPSAPASAKAISNVMVVSTVHK